jgi:hypothetical protein
MGPHRSPIVGLVEFDAEPLGDPTVIVDRPGRYGELVAGSETGR